MQAIRQSTNKCDPQTFLFIPHFIELSKAEVFEFSSRDLPAKRVMCGIPNVTWDEQDIPRDHMLFRFFEDEVVVNQVRRAASISDGMSLKSLQVWISRYRVGEYINPHKDGDGTVQMIMCLKAGRVDNGGALCLKVGEENRSIFLTPGDTIIFNATSIEHFTTPLVTTPGNPNPIRIVAVARYYF